MGRAGNLTRRSCDDWIVRLGDDADDAPKQLDAQGYAPTFRLLFVTGVLGECFSNQFRLFGDARQRLGAEGHVVREALVHGRAGADLNAAIVRDAVVAMRGEGRRPLIVIAYSKGAVDTITALVKYPEIREDVTAVLTVAGAVNGSPLAASFTGLYGATIGAVPLEGCAQYDHDEVTSLVPTVRLNWLASNRLPTGIRYFSLVGAPQADRVSFALKPFYARLSERDLPNDGQLVYSDAVVPGGALLGYVNADHWAIALRIKDDAPFLTRAFVDRNDFPRTEMLEAAIAVMARAMQIH